MMKYIKKSLVLSAIIKKKLATSDLQHLEQLKDRLKSRFGAAPGIHMAGIPIAISMILAIFCYAMPQVYVWMLLFRWLGIPEYKVLMGFFFCSDRILRSYHDYNVTDCSRLFKRI